MQAGATDKNKEGTCARAKTWTQKEATSELASGYAPLSKIVNSYDIP